MNTKTKRETEIEKEDSNINLTSQVWNAVEKYRSIQWMAISLVVH